MPGKVGWVVFGTNGSRCSRASRDSKEYREKPLANSQRGEFEKFNVQERAVEESYDHVSKESGKRG